MPIAITPGGGRIGSLLSGALVEVPVGNRLVDVTISDVDALIAGLTHGGTARVITVRADDLPQILWPAARPATGRPRRPSRRPRRHQNRAVESGRPRRESISDDRAMTIFWPVPKLVIVGSGPIATRSAPQPHCSAGSTEITNDVATADGPHRRARRLSTRSSSPAHDLELAGPALAAGARQRRRIHRCARRTEDAADPSRLAGVPRHHRARPHPRAGRARHRRRHAAEGRDLDPRRGDRGRGGPAYTGSR